mgnify:FL=1
MEEKEILLKTIEGLNASIASLSTTNKNQSEQIKNLQETYQGVDGSGRMAEPSALWS